MATSILTVAFEGIEAVPVTVQVQLLQGLPAFTIVGLPDKAVVESRERVRACFSALGLDLPLKKITVNLAPADLQKEGSHYDLPIAVAILVTMGIIPAEEVLGHIVIGELSLDGKITKVSGALPAAIVANSLNLGLVCPLSCSNEAMWAGNKAVVPAGHLLDLINHYKGRQLLPHPKFIEGPTKDYPYDLAEVRGQELGKRALEIMAAGGHNLLMIGPPGAGKSMLASRLPSIMPPLTPAESLEVTMIHSLIGNLPESGLIRQRPYRDPHHSASLPALVGGGMRCKPGEISLAHHGVLFLDELPEFSRQALEALRQPLETGKISIARANAHISYPAQFQLIAAMNPCRCGYCGDSERECSKAPRCSNEYQSKISGPLLDRFDMVINIANVQPKDLLQKTTAESSKKVAERVIKAHEFQKIRSLRLGYSHQERAPAVISNAHLEKALQINSQAKELLQRVTETFRLSGRGYYRLLRVARTIADLDGMEEIMSKHLSEAVGYRKITNYTNKGV